MLFRTSTASHQTRIYQIHPFTNSTQNPPKNYPQNQNLNLSGTETQTAPDGAIKFKWFGIEGMAG